MTRRMLWAALAVLMVAAPASAQGVLCPGLGAAPNTIGFEQVTVSTVAVGFTVATMGRAVMAVAYVESQPIRYRTDRTAPTATVGMKVDDATQLVVCGSDLSTIQFIRDTSATGSATLDVTYYGY